MDFFNVTLEEFLIWNGKDAEGYSKLLSEKHEIEHKLRKASENLQWEEGSLSVFTDTERRSIQYMKHRKLKEEHEQELAELRKRYDIVNQRILRYIN